MNSPPNQEASESKPTMKILKPASREQEVEAKGWVKKPPGTKTSYAGQAASQPTNLEASKNNDTMDQLFGDSEVKVSEPDEAGDMFDSGSTTNSAFTQNKSNTYVPGQQKNSKKTILRRDPALMAQSEIDRLKKEEEMRESLKNEPTIDQREREYNKLRKEILGNEDVEGQLGDLSLTDEAKPQSKSPVNSPKSDSPRKTKDDPTFEKQNSEPKLLTQSSKPGETPPPTNPMKTGYMPKGNPRPRYQNSRPVYSGYTPGVGQNNAVNSSYGSNGAGPNGSSKYLLPTPDKVQGGATSQGGLGPQGQGPPGSTATGYVPRTQNPGVPNGPDQSMNGPPKMTPNGVPMNPNYKGKAHNYIPNFKPHIRPQTVRREDGAVVKTDKSGMQHYYPPNSAPKGNGHAPSPRYGNPRFKASGDHHQGGHPGSQGHLGHQGGGNAGANHSGGYQGGNSHGHNQNQNHNPNHLGHNPRGGHGSGGHMSGPNQNHNPNYHGQKFNSFNNPNPNFNNMYAHGSNMKGYGQPHTPNGGFSNGPPNFMAPNAASFPGMDGSSGAPMAYGGIDPSQIRTLTPGSYGSFPSQDYMGGGPGPGGVPSGGPGGAPGGMMPGAPPVNNFRPRQPYNPRPRFNNNNNKFNNYQVRNSYRGQNPGHSGGNYQKGYNKGYNGGRFKQPWEGQQ